MSQVIQHSREFDTNHCYSISELSSWNFNKGETQSLYDALTAPEVHRCIIHSSLHLLPACCQAAIVWKKHTKQYNELGQCTNQHYGKSVLVNDI